MKTKQKSWFQRFRKQGALQVFAWLGMLYLIIFNLIPMFGIIMGFKDYSISSGIKGIFTSEWVGLKYFKEFVTDYKFGTLVRNTVALSVLKLIFTFPLPILFALMVNEIRNLKFKKILQTCSYLPHFISWVIISNISYQFLSQSGIVNTLLQFLHLTSEPIGFLTAANKFWGLAVFLDVWKEMGWWTIIFLAAIVGISNDYYEAAQIDGASRMQRIRYITLPCIKGTIVVVLIMTMGNLFGGGLSGSNFEQCYLLGNSVNAAASDIIQTYVFKVGLSQGRYAYATAVGLIQSVISLILIFVSNFTAKKIAGSGLF
jgi:putative aldouronate transport system permease protein